MARDRRWIVLWLGAVLAGLGVWYLWAWDRPWNLGSVTAPDGRLVATVVVQQKHAIPLPGPEPPALKAQRCWLRVETGGKKIWSSAAIAIAPGEAITDVTDLAWAPDSTRLAARILDELIVVEPRQGRVERFRYGGALTRIASFRWVSDHELDILLKELDAPDSAGLTGYRQYGTKTTGLQMVRQNVADGSTKVLTEARTAPSGFIFRTLVMTPDELSPFSPWVAYPDGACLCVTDYGSGRGLLRTAVTGTIDSVWWANARSLVIAVSEPTGGDWRFLWVSMDGQAPKDVTTQAQPYRQNMHYTRDWLAKLVP